MPAQDPQRFENHQRFVPTYHYLISSILLLNLIWSVYQLIGGFSMATLVPALLAVALVFVFLHMRFFPLKVQDRVIRLEERMRLERLLPHDERHRIEDLTVNQLIALRFASDAEVADLTLAVLNEGLDDRTAIKKRIADWRADHLRV